MKLNETGAVMPVEKPLVGDTMVIGTDTSDLLNFKTWRIGDVTITRVLEFPTSTLPPQVLLKASPEDVLRHAWLQPEFATPEGLIKINIQAFIIESQGKRIMVDPCVGNDKKRDGASFNMLNNPFLERLEAAGFPRESIDIVLCTHLHTDHCGWNTMLVDGKWVPTFPNAAYLFARGEYEFAKVDKGEEQEATYQDSIKPIIEAGLAQLVEYDHMLSDEVWFEHSPGHTPGHCSIIISSKGEEALISGDVMHHPLQAAEPHVCSYTCWNDELAITSRRRILEKSAESGRLVLGTHFAGPSAVRVKIDGDVWKMEGA
ncbi:MBL fold metallo-hydrolase [Pseudomonas gingeri]|uniref:MBL fold metallo-hydrolase n=1 Tax=Pseudomonas gingeri TaxID=117681 RepID=A0A7Y7X9F9_9PSED|nr:MBL fold metallo-hydrolase [Pseudomonas gingeri]NWA28616.1 MBL fold metallo-hydrolase [Pseudomonas gingeri]NWB95694.1 MBL fold metallo-hydrolase [Pseudomonas gingeri]